MNERMMLDLGRLLRITTAISKTLTAFLGSTEVEKSNFILQCTYGQTPGSTYITVNAINILQQNKPTIFIALLSAYHLRPLVLGQCPLASMAMGFSLRLDGGCTFTYKVTVPR